MEWLRFYVWLEGWSGSIFCLVGRMSINRLLIPLAPVWWDPHVMHWSSSSPPLREPLHPAHPLPAAVAGLAAPCQPPSSARARRTSPAVELRVRRPPLSSARARGRSSCSTGAPTRSRPPRLRAPRAPAAPPPHRPGSTSRRSKLRRRPSARPARPLRHGGRPGRAAPPPAPPGPCAATVVPAVTPLC